MAAFCGGYKSTTCICIYNAVASAFYTDVLLILDSRLFSVSQFRGLLLIYMQLWKRSSQVLNSCEDRV